MPDFKNTLTVNGSAVALIGHTHAAATTGSDGFMSSSDKSKLNMYPYPIDQSPGSVLKINDTGNFASYSYVKFSEILDRPTTIAGYGITDALSVDYVPAMAATFAVDPTFSLKATDIRTLTNPTLGIGYPQGIRARFSAWSDDNAAPYADVIDLSTYADNSGGGFNALYFNKASQTIRHKFAAAGATSWTVKTLAYLEDAEFLHQSNSAMAVGAGNLAPLEVKSTGTGAAFMTFHRSGTNAYAVYFGLDTDNVLKVGGWSLPSAAYPILHTGNSSNWLFNNRGQPYSSYTSFAAIPDFGPTFVNNGTDNPAGAPSQWYTQAFGLGSDYPFAGANSHALQYAQYRPGGGGSNGGSYLWYRFKESNVWQAWSKISAGYADAANNSALLNGLQLAPTTAPPGNHVLRSDSSGYVNFNYINSNTANSENPTVSQVIVTNGGDNYYRKASLGHLAQQMGAWVDGNRPGPYRLFRRDSSSNYSVQTYWDNTYWVLAGYGAGDAYHAGVRVSYSDTTGGAGNFAVTGRSGFNTPFWSSATIMVDGFSDGSDTYPLLCRNSSDANRMYVRSDGYLFAVQNWTISDERMKDFIADIDNPLDMILALRPRSFVRKDNFARGRMFGLIAQEAVDIIPEAFELTRHPVVSGPGEVDFEGSPKLGDPMYTADYSMLIAPLIGAVQALNARIVELEERIALNG